MKWIAITLTALTIILAILYLTIGGMVLAITLATIGLTAIMVSIFSLGIWYAHQSIRLGAKLVTEAQNNNDHWDTVKMQSLTQFGGEMLKLKGVDNKYPSLESGSSDNFNAPFTIQGISDTD